MSRHDPARGRVGERDDVGRGAAPEDDVVVIPPAEHVPCMHCGGPLVQDRCSWCEVEMKYEALTWLSELQREDE
jgi:hypothetical protein